VLAWLAFALVWLRGGPVERFGAGVLICDYILTALAAGTDSPVTIMAASAGVIAMIFSGLAFRSDRWWPFVTGAALMLLVMVNVLEWMTADLSRYAAESARLGLWIVVYLSLIAGVAERWLAGDNPGRGMAVRRSHVHAP
jgi:hypothetical protein